MALQKEEWEKYRDNQVREKQDKKELERCVRNYGQVIGEAFFQYVVYVRRYGKDEKSEQLFDQLKHVISMTLTTTNQEQQLQAISAMLDFAEQRIKDSSKGTSLSDLTL